MYFAVQMADISTKHDGSRVVQFCITNGSAEQRSIIAKVSAYFVIFVYATTLQCQHCPYDPPLRPACVLFHLVHAHHLFGPPGH